MSRVIGGFLKATLCFGALLLAGGTAFGAGPQTYQITPDKTMMAIGESRSFRMVAENGPAAQEQQQQDQKPPADKTPADGAPQPSTTASTGKPASKPRHVITDDDIKPSADSGFGGLFYTSAGRINDCDANCFDRVHAMAMVNSQANPIWREEVLRQLDVVRSDGEWQAYLHDMFRAHNKVCQLTFDKQDELRRSGGSLRDLGPQQIAITEKYDERTKAAQDELSAQVARQQPIQRKFAEKPYANAFATIQGTRMAGGFCTNSGADPGPERRASGRPTHARQDQRRYPLSRIAVRPGATDGSQVASAATPSPAQNGRRSESPGV